MLEYNKAFDEWTNSQEDLDKKHARYDESFYETFYITGEDLQNAFKAGMKNRQSEIDTLLEQISDLSDELNNNL